MKHIVTALALSLAAGGVFAQASAAVPAASKPMTAQQQKMGDCATQNKGKKGDDYKSGVKACMSAPAASAASTMTPQQQKMSDCSKANKGKKGDDYKSGVKACMSASAASK